ncbi:hypothetical protein ACP4OV_030680 [Aristida adscensionis]
MAGTAAAAFKFTVHRRPAGLVPPAAPTPHELKLLSDIDDQELLRAHIPFILFYRHDVDAASIGAARKDPAPAIRDALARALVHYYPLAGRLRELHGRELAVDCTGEGALFIDADADVSLRQLGAPLLLPPFPCVDELLFDVPGSSAVIGSPVLLVQVTRLSCGGFVLAVRVSHAMVDASGLVQFLSAMAELARGGASSAPAPALRPAWRRELLRARDPPRPRFAHREYDGLEARDTGNLTLVDDADAVHRCFLFGPRDIAALRERLPPRLRSGATTFDILMGCLWKVRTAALAPDADVEMRMICVVNGRPRRRRGGGGGTGSGVLLPRGYYGNAVSFPVAISAADKLCSRPLSYAVELVMEAKAEVTMDAMEYMRSVADLMALRGRPGVAMANTYVVSDQTKAGRAGAGLDFGWGRPAYVGPTVGAINVPGPGAFSFLVQFRSAGAGDGARGEEGIAVPVCLPGAAMGRFEEEMGKLLPHPAVDVSRAQQLQQPRSAL